MQRDVGLGICKDGPGTVYDVLDRLRAARGDRRPAHDRAALGLAPAGPDLAGANVELPRIAGLRDTACATRSRGVRERYAFTLLDCPPSLGPLTVNALVAADRVIVPVQAEYFALEGLAGCSTRSSLVQRELNPRLTVAGMLLTMHDARTRLAQDVEREVRQHFPDLVFDTVIPRNVRIGEAPSFGKPVIHPRSALRRRGRLLRAGKGGGRPWLSDRRASAAGLAAILTVSPQDEPEELRQVPVDLIDPNPNQPRRMFDEEALRRAGRLDPRARRASADPRATARRAAATS